MLTHFEAASARIQRPPLEPSQWHQASQLLFQNLSRPHDARAYRSFGYTHRLRDLVRSLLLDRRECQRLPIDGGIPVRGDDGRPRC
jgi:hypothetical protein